MIEIQFFTTLGCHLCEDAEQIFSSLVNNGTITVESIDIIDDEEFLELYRLRIPVIKRADSGLELDWPFDYQDLTQFLNLPSPSSSKT